LLLCAFAGHAQAGPPFAVKAAPPTISVNVRLVNVFVNVTDDKGAPVPGLTRDEFLLSEDDHPQKIAVFERQSELPLEIVLAIDTSGSVHKDLGLEQDAARHFVHSLLRPVDHLDLMEFADNVREVVFFTNNPGRIDRGLNDMGRGRRHRALQRRLSRFAEPGAAIRPQGAGDHLRRRQYRQRHDL
jgi:Ca-activated chloride channel family protein